MKKAIATLWGLILVFGAAPALPVLLALQPPTPASSADTAPAAPGNEAAALDKKILAEAKNGSEIMVNLTHLSDVIGSRLTGTAALKKANDWAADKMKAYGLSNVHLEGWTIPVGWERGTASVRIVEPTNGLTLTVAAMAWTPGTKGRITGDVVALNTRDRTWMAAHKGKLKGAIVLRGAPDKVGPTNRAPKGTDTGKPAAKEQVKAVQKSEAARPDSSTRASAKEIVEFLHHEGVAVLMTDAGKPHGLLDMDGSWRGDDRVSGGDPLPTLFVAHEHYALLHRLASRPAPAATRVEVEITSKLVPGPIPVYNTVGEIRGSEKPDEFVVLGAHLDSWDLAQGTTDNGTGTTVVLEAARILVKSGARPKRTIRFALFTGEEQGLFGSKEYVKKHQDEMAKTSLALVHDNGTGKVIGIDLQGRPVIKPIMERELVSLKSLGVTDFTLRSTSDTDHKPFDKAGVPGFAVRQDETNYNLTWHTQLDSLEMAREPDLIQGAQAMAVTAIRVANLPELLPRDKPKKKQ